MQAGHRDVAVVVVQAGQQPNQRAEGIWHHPAPHPRMQAVIERGDLDDAIGQAPQRHRERRRLRAPVVRVGDDDHVGGEQVTVGPQQGSQRRRTRLLLPFHEHRDADGQIVAERPNGGEMRCDACFVVRGASAVEATVALGGFERRRCPLRHVALGLHVMVGVEQDRQGADRRRAPGDDSRGTALADGADVVEARLGQQLRHHLGAAVHFIAAAGVGPHRLDSDEILEIGAHRWQHRLHPVDEIAHGNERSGSPLTASRQKRP